MISTPCPRCHYPEMPVPTYGKSGYLRGRCPACHKSSRAATSWDDIDKKFIVHYSADGHPSAPDGTIQISTRLGRVSERVAAHISALPPSEKLTAILEKFPLEQKIVV